MVVCPRKIHHSNVAVQAIGPKRTRTLLCVKLLYFPF